MGFFTYWDKKLSDLDLTQSQSLSGWDGVFHECIWAARGEGVGGSQSLSGWDGVFHLFAGAGRGR